MLKYPCKDCNKRYPGCHDKCEAYQDIHKKQQEIYKARKDNSELLNSHKYRLHCMKTRRKTN